MYMTKLYFCFMLIFIFTFIVVPVLSQEPEVNQGIDEKVRKFLESRGYTWRDMKVP